MSSMCAGFSLRDFSIRFRRSVMALRSMVVLRFYLGDQIFDGRVKRFGKRCWIKSNPEYQNDEGNHGAQFPGRHVRQLFVFRMRYFEKHHSLEHPQHVARGKNDSGRGHNSEGPLIPEYSQKNQKLADEPVGPRQTDRRQGHDHKTYGEHWDHLGQSAKILNESRVPPVIDHADQQKERSRGDAVIDVL